MLFQKQKISRDVQNMMPKIKTYRSIPKKKICTSSSSLLIRSRKFSMTSRIKKIRLPKKNIRSRDCERTLTSDIGDSVMRGETRPPWSVDSRLRTHHLSIFLHNGGPYGSVVKSTWADHCRKKNRVNRELKVQNMPPQRNINSTRLQADKKKH